MNRTYLLLLCAISLFFDCSLRQSSAAPPDSQSISPASQSISRPPAQKSTAKPVATKKQEAEIRALVEQLVFVEPENPNDQEAQGKQMDICYDAFKKLFEFKGLAFPILIEHLDDKRESIHFRNHYLGHSVGDACYWNIYFQLLDRPKDYSRYGYSRKGRDGKSHPKPVWKGKPFDDAGGLRKWLIANKDLSYTEQQIKCLKWLLEKEKKIGAPDAESYFINILPLEIRIRERQLELGMDVKSELKRLRKIKSQKMINEIPKELLPEK